MTKSPHTIGIEQSLLLARRLMKEHRLHHLPVRDGEDFVGILSDREVRAFEVLPGSRDLTVEEAMVPEVLVVFEGAPLEPVIAEMTRRQIGSAVVVAAVDETEVLGVFTAPDVLRALLDALQKVPSAQQPVAAGVK